MLDGVFLVKIPLSGEGVQTLLVHHLFALCLLTHIAGRDGVDQEKGRHDDRPPDQRGGAEDHSGLRCRAQAYETRAFVRFQEKPLFRQVPL